MTQNKLEKPKLENDDKLQLELFEMKRMHDLYVQNGGSKWWPDDLFYEAVCHGDKPKWCSQEDVYEDFVPVSHAHIIVREHAHRFLTGIGWSIMIKKNEMKYQSEYVNRNPAHVNSVIDALLLHHYPPKSEQIDSAIAESGEGDEDDLTQQIVSESDPELVRLIYARE